MLRLNSKYINYLKGDRLSCVDCDVNDSVLNNRLVPINPTESRLRLEINTKSTWTTRRTLSSIRDSTMAYRANSSGGGSYSEDDDTNGGSSGSAAQRNVDAGSNKRLQSDLRDKPLYLLEHLATFTVHKESGIVMPADGIRRLLQLEKTTGIWSQKMQLCLDREWVLIIDFETGNIIERFPATLIIEPTAFTSNSPMDMYNNVLVFIVGGGSGTRSEMHIFQCQSTSAVHIVEDLKQVRSGQPVTHVRNLSQMSSPALVQKVGATTAAVSSLAPNYDADADASSELSVVVEERKTSSNRRPLQHQQFIRHHRHSDEISSTSSEKYERDVTVLNHCFDDIEKFIARLQHAAAASRELEHRQHSRKSKKKWPGEGLLTLRTKPPYEKEFVDIFAKFKLSFNLLAKLKAHIHDPNAPELIHFLFTPLALIVDASHDAYYNPNISGRTIDPLLTREAVNLLCNCVTSKETELWRSLGEAWTIPRDQWKDHVGSYHPVFFDGWSPEYPVIDDLDDEFALLPHSNLTQLTTVAVRRHGDVGSQYTTEFEYDPKYHPPSSPGPQEFSTTRSEISVESTVVETHHAAAVASLIGGPNTKAWLDELQDHGARVVQATHPRTANNDKELTVLRGEYLEVLDDTRKWWKCRNIRGHIGHVPHTIIVPFNYNDMVVYNTQQIPNHGRNGAGRPSRSAL